MYLDINVGMFNFYVHNSWITFYMNRFLEELLINVTKNIQARIQLDKKNWGRTKNFNNKTSKRDWKFKGEMQQGIIMLFNNNLITYFTRNMIRLDIFLKTSGYFIQQSTLNPIFKEKKFNWNIKSSWVHFPVK